MNLAKHWKRAIGGLIAAVLLLPVPAMAALTFNGSWVATYAQSGGPTTAKPTFTDYTDNAHQEDQLLLNNPNYQGSTAPATSTIELTRGFTLSTSNQKLEFEDAFVELLNHAGGSVSVAVKNSSGATVLTPLNSVFSTTGSKLVAQFNEVFKNTLAKGNYTLDIKITYNTNNKVGSWKSISPNHYFEFQGF